MPDQQGAEDGPFFMTHARQLVPPKKRGFTPAATVSAANRRNLVLGQCWQLKQDMDSYSERRCPDKPIQIDFNFNIDLEELGQLNDVG